MNYQRVFLGTALSLISFAALSQVNISQYFDQGSIPFLSRSIPVKVDVKWDMDGQSQALLNDGLTNLDEGKLHLASGNFEAFVNTNYKSWVGHFYLGQSYLHLGRFKDAEREFTAATKLNPASAESLLQLGEAYEALHQYSKAQSQYEHAVAADAKYIYAHFKLGNILFKTGQPDAAIRQYKKCNKIDARFPDAYMAQGIILFMREKKIKESITLFSAALKADSTFSPAYFWRGVMYLEEGKKDIGLMEWNHFVRYQPRNQFVLTMRGLLNTELGNFDEAFSDFRKTLEAISVNEDKFRGAQSPLDKRIDLQFTANYLIKKGYGLNEDVFTDLKAGFCLLLMGQERKAYEYFKKAEKQTSSPALFFMMAVGFEHAQRHNFAFNYYRKALSYDPDIFDAHKKMSIYYSELKRWDDAYKEISEMLRIQPENPVAFKLKGMMEATQRRYEKAIDDLNRFIATDSTDTDAYRNRAMCYSATKKADLAQLDVRRLLLVSQKSDKLYELLLNDFLVLEDTATALYVFRDFANDNPGASTYLEIAKLLTMQRKLDEAQAELDKANTYMKARGTNPTITKAANSLGLCIKAYRLFPQAMFEEAMRIADQAIAADDTNLEARYLKAKCYLGLGNKEKAIEEFLNLKQRKYRDASDLYDELTDH